MGVGARLTTGKPCIAHCFAEHSKGPASLIELLKFVKLTLPGDDMPVDRLAEFVGRITVQTA